MVALVLPPLPQAWDVGHQVASASNPLPRATTALSNLAQLTATLKPSQVPCSKEKPVRNLLLQDLGKLGHLPRSYPQALFPISRCAN